jgi:hypothetical protein
MAGIFFKTMVQHYFEGSNVADYVVIASPDADKKRELTALMEAAGLEQEGRLALSEDVLSKMFDKLSTDFDVYQQEEDPRDSTVVIYLRLLIDESSPEKIGALLAPIREKHPGLDYEIEDRTNLPDDDPMDG